MTPTAISTILTNREKEVLTLLANDLTSKQVGTELGITHKTVEAHRENIKNKTHIRGLAGLTKLAITLGLVKVE